MHITFGQHSIPYRIHRQSQPVFRVTVMSGGNVIVTVPDDKTVEEIQKRIQRKAKWIIKQIHFFEQQSLQLPPRSYVNGETHYYLGRQYRLKIDDSATTSQQCVLKGGYFYLTVTSKESVRALLENWYREKAKRYFQERIEVCVVKMKYLGLHLPKLQIRKMKRRWGSCTKSGKIILNLDLIKMPPTCIDYVIIHELCHLIERHHSPKFYRLISSILPEWKKLKKRLEILKKEM
jgi:predicted metal-dependent hydrolase